MPMRYVYLELFARFGMDKDFICVPIGGFCSWLGQSMFCMHGHEMEQIELPPIGTLGFPSSLRFLHVWAGECPHCHRVYFGLACQRVGLAVAHRGA